MGYSLYLQRRWGEAEMNLRQALALKPSHSRAHNNLALVLAHGERLDEAFAEFRKAGCTEADARVNMAFVLTLERHWPEARRHYERALAADPSSTPAKKGLEQLSVLVAKAAPADRSPSAPGQGPIVPVAYRAAPDRAAPAEKK
jgi:Flp pilus assembly protein TadD